MPELPEVETVRLALTDTLLKSKITKISILTKKLRFELPKEFSEKVKEVQITEILRRGKYLIINLKNKQSLLIHLGMTGLFKITRDYAFEKHDHIIFFLKDKVVTFNDIRRFGFFKIYKTQDLYQSSHLKGLGEEPLEKDFNLEYILKKTYKKKQNIKSFLMNQNNIAGLGNIYCSEALFDAFISPLRMVNEIHKNEMQGLVKSVKKILRKAIKLGGTSLKNYKSPDGSVGYFINNLKVYGRNEKYCLRCKQKTKILKIVQQNRSTFYCQKCQK